VQNHGNLEFANTDWTHHYKGHSELLLKPSNADQVSNILSYCNEKRLPVVPQAGKTGLVGGSVPIMTEIVLSLERLNKIHGLNELGVLQAQAGCVLQDLQDYCCERNKIVPIDIGARGTAQIGGNVSTNAGGQYFSRYGSIAGNLLGLEVVLADGRILQCRSNLKDNTGYKLHQMFVGAEGTLGVVTEVALLCPPSPKSRHAAFIAFSTYEHVVGTMEMAKKELGEILAAFEWMDRSIINLIDSPRFPFPRQDECSYFALVETHGIDEAHDSKKMERFLELSMASKLVVNGALAQDLSQVLHFWKIRESASSSIAKVGYTYKYDVSLPILDFENFINIMKRHLEPFSLTFGNWGHILDGNLHFNICSPGEYEKTPQVVARLEPFIYEQVIKLGGSISAEHGLGQCKNEYLSMIHDRTTLDTMYDLKRLYDPNNILNPGKLLPTHSGIADNSTCKK
jgi:FAD/FMN-containing dehydrogenase